MLKLADLLEKRSTILARMTEAHEKDQPDAFTAVETELRSLDAQITRQKTIEAADRADPGTPIAGDQKLSSELHKRFSLVRCMAMQAGIGGHDFGFEREVQPELVKRVGKTPEGGVLAPLEVFLERRALTSTNPGGGPGGNLIATELHSEMYFDRLRAALRVQSLGATVLSNLVGNVDIPGLKDLATVGWVAEDTALTGSTPGFRKVSLTPKHAGALTEVSRNMLLQVSRDVEMLVRNDFAQLLAGTLDKAAIAGSGTGAEPRGILNTVGIGAVAMGTNGGAFTGDAARDLIGKVDVADAPATSRGFLSTNRVKTAAMKLKDAQGNYMGFGPDGVFAGERAEFTGNVPSNLTKGMGNNLSAVIYGNWADLLIGYWSAFDVLVNPFESAAYAKGNVSVRAIMTCDIAVRYAESFAASQDVVAA